MDLRTFISDMGRRRSLAEACGSDPDYLYQVATGRRNASPRLASKIEEQSRLIGPEVVTKESIIFGPASDEGEGGEVGRAA